MGGGKEFSRWHFRDTFLPSAAEAAAKDEDEDVLPIAWNSAYEIWSHLIILVGW